MEYRDLLISMTPYIRRCEEDWGQLTFIGLILKNINIISVRFKVTEVKLLSLDEFTDPERTHII